MAGNVGDKWIVWYTGFRAGLVQSLGVVGRSTITGADLPALTGLDCLTVLGSVTPSVAKAVERISHDGKVWPTAAMSSDGNLFTTLVPSIGVNVYLSSGVAHPQTPWRRTITKTGGPVTGPTGIVVQVEDQVISFEPGRTNQIPLVSAARHAIAPWQRLVDATADALRTYGPFRKLSLPYVESVMSAFYQCAIALATAEEFPPVATWELAKEAARDALDKGAAALGEVTAAVAEGVGETIGIAAGGVARGFFGEAGFTALAIGGAAVYLYVR